MTSLNLRHRISDHIDQIQDAYNMENHLNDFIGRLKFTPTADYKSDVIAHSKNSNEILVKSEALYEETYTFFKENVDEKFSSYLENLLENTFDLGRVGVKDMTKEHPLEKSQLLCWSAISYLDIYDYLNPRDEDVSAEVGTSASETNS